jgi:ApaG protein
MYAAVTRNIKVTVEPAYSPERSDPDEPRFFWTYTVEIANLGEQPTLAPGESFRYSSGCPLRTPSGIMVGAYRMVCEDGDVFEVAIPAFSLDSPQARRVLN